MLSVRHYTPTEGYTYLLNPGELGCQYLHFGILNLPPQSKYFDHSEDCEVVLIPLAGRCTLLVGHNGNKANGILGSRDNVFAGDAAAAFIPHHTTFEVITGSDSVEIVFCKTLSHNTSAAAILEAGQLETPTGYQLHIIENYNNDELVGEAVCLLRFQSEVGSVMILPIDSAEDTKQFKLYNNDITLIPENIRTRLLDFEGISYQLIVRYITLPQ